LASQTTGPIVLRHGFVKGMDRKTDCDVLARKLPIPSNRKGGLPDFTYTDCAVIDAPVDLPDGEYMVHFDDHVVAATKEGGCWLTRGRANKSRVPLLIAS
jgi:hypothetical protein